VLALIDAEADPDEFRLLVKKSVVAEEPICVSEVVIMLSKEA